MLSRVISNAFPEQAKHDEVAMLRMNTCPSQFNHLRAKRLEDSKLELLRAVVATIRRRVVPGLQSVCANDSGGGPVLNAYMIPNSSQRGLNQAGGGRMLSPFLS